MATNWHNSDQLYIKFGPNEATPAKVGSLKTFGPVRTIEFTLLLTALTDAAAIVDDHIKLPKYAQVETIEIVNEVAATSGGSATLRIGQIDADRASNGDDDSFVADAALATFNAAGERNLIVSGGTGAGVGFGPIFSKSVYLTASYETAAFTAGKLKVRLNYRLTQ